MTESLYPEKSEITLGKNMPLVRTSDGHLLPWDKEAIVNQLTKETVLARIFFDIPPIAQHEAEEIAIRVEQRIRLMELKFISGPLIREIVNIILLEESISNPEYKIYRNILTRVGCPIYDAFEIDVGDGFEAKENANLQPNSETAHKKKADRASKEEYLLLLPPDLADAHLSGDFHIHDLDYFGTRPFCQDWDLRYFLYYGFMPDGLGTRTSVAGPANRAEVAVLHSVKVLAAAQTNFAGGEGFYNYLVFLAPYMSGLSYAQIRQLMQMMFFELTQMYVARGGQPVFSNIQVTPGVPELWKDKPAVYRGRVGPETYGEFEDEVRLMFRAINEVALEGDYWGKPFNFPKLENGLEPDMFKPEYDDDWMLVHEVAAKHGSPYFDNLMPSYRGYGKGVSCYQCCAYCFVETPETDSEFEEKMHFDDGKHFSMGSWQVVSLNLPRAAYRAEGDDQKLFEELRRLLDQSVRVFMAKKNWMNLMLENKRIPFATQTPRDPVTGHPGATAVDFDELVYTIGLVGANEMAQYHTGTQLHESAESVKITIKALLEMKRYLKELQEKHEIKLALARTPAESCAQRLAVADMTSTEFRDRSKQVVKGDRDTSDIMMRRGLRDVPIYYSNGTHTYVGAQISLGERIDIEHKFFPVLSGGNMFHVWLGEENPDAEALYRLTKKIATGTQIGYFAYTKDLTLCITCRSVSGGLKDKCVNCGSSNVEWWSRITGYYQNVTGWNKAKRRELTDRYRARASW